jgi:hypothetical protein
VLGVAIAKLAVLERRLAQVGARDATIHEPAMLESGALQRRADEGAALERASAKGEIRQVAVRPVGVAERQPLGAVARLQP